MPTNHFFSKGTISEQHLYEDLAIEAIQIYGHDVYYLPRTMVNKDELFGESPLSKFSDAYMIEMYMDTNEGYEGEKEIITRFGLEIRDETTFTVSRRRWLDLVSSNSNLITALRPNEGDWIYMPTVGRLLEISFVDKDDPFYQLDNLPVYKLFTRTVEYSSEDLDTGIAAIDAIETQRSTDALDWQFLGEQAGRATLYNNLFSLERGRLTPGFGCCPQAGWARQVLDGERNQSQLGAGPRRGPGSLQGDPFRDEGGVLGAPDGQSLRTFQREGRHHC